MPTAPPATQQELLNYNPECPDWVAVKVLGEEVEEEMAARRPEVILLPDEPYAFSAADIADFMPFSEVPAVRDRRIALIDGKIVTWYGPRIGQNLRTLRQLLRP